jgi:hypothetical protein
LAKQPSKIQIAIDAFKGGDESLAMSILVPIVESSARRLFRSRCTVDFDEMVQQSVISLWETVLAKVDSGRMECGPAYVRRCIYFALLQSYRRERLLRAKEIGISEAMGITVPDKPDTQIGSWLLRAAPDGYGGFLEMLVDYVDEHNSINGFVTWAAAVMNVSVQRVSQRLAVLRSCLTKAAERRGIAAAAN